MIIGLIILAWVFWLVSLVGYCVFSFGNKYKIVFKIPPVLITNINKLNDEISKRVSEIFTKKFNLNSEFKLDSMEDFITSKHIKVNEINNETTVRLRVNLWYLVSKYNEFLIEQKAEEGK